MLLPITDDIGRIHNTYRQQGPGDLQRRAVMIKNGICDKWLFFGCFDQTPSCLAMVGAELFVFTFWRRRIDQRVLKYRIKFFLEVCPQHQPTDVVHQTRQVGIIWRTVTQSLGQFSGHNGA